MSFRHAYSVCDQTAAIGCPALLNVFALFEDYVDDAALLRDRHCRTVPDADFFEPCIVVRNDAEAANQRAKSNRR